MKYVFFDIECCNGHDICEFGYVVTDEKLNILEKQNFTVDPQAEFNLPPRNKENPFKLSYPKSVYRDSPDFTYFYERIAGLLCSEDHIAVGYSIINDVTFLRIACKRYSLAPFTFPFFDVQRMMGKYLGIKQQISLTRAAEHMGIDTTGVVFHNSGCDAEITMLVVKALAEQKGKSVSGIFEMYPSCEGRSKNGYGYFCASGKSKDESGGSKKGKCLAEFAVPKEIRRAVKYITPATVGVPQVLKDKKVCIGDQFEIRQTERTIKLIRAIKDHGGEYTSDAKQCDIFIRVDIRDEKGKMLPSPRLRAVNKRRAKRRRSVRKYDLVNFLRLMSMTRADLDNIPLPSMDVLFPEYADSKSEPRRADREKSKSEKVFDYLLTIPRGKVVTYGQIAEYLGNKKMARAVGNILHRNPDGDKYPCYKVVNQKGRLSESYAFGGITAQKARLEGDGITVVDDTVDLAVYQYKM